MPSIEERRIYQIFELSVVLKGAHAAVECLSAAALVLTSNAAILRLVTRLTQHELIENPHDFIANHLVSWAQGFSVQTQHFYALYLLSHGAVKLALVAGLLQRKLWAYPASIAALGLFISYQIYRYSQTHGNGLVVLTILDIVVMALVWHEYRLLRRHLPLD
jgi:uncharacterized membrane protein